MVGSAPSGRRRSLADGRSVVTYASSGLSIRYTFWSRTYYSYADKDVDFVYDYILLHIELVYPRIEI